VVEAAEVVAVGPADARIFCFVIRSLLALHLISYFVLCQFLSHLSNVLSSNLPSNSPG